MRGRHWAPRIVFWGGAVLVGLSAVALTQLGNLANTSFLMLYQHWPWVPFLVSPAGLVLSLWLTRRFFPGAQGSGIPQVIAALSPRTGGSPSRLLSVRIAIGKILLTTLGLFAGASIGREGPTVHVGASFTAAAGRLAGIKRIHQASDTLEARMAELKQVLEEISEQHRTAHAAFRRIRGQLSAAP